MNINDYLDISFGDLFDSIPVTEAVSAKYEKLSAEEKIIWKEMVRDYNEALSKSTILLDNILPAINKNLKKNERKLFSYISKFRDRHLDVLSSPYILKDMIFTDTDRKIVFDCIGLEEDEIQEFYDKIEKPPGDMTRSNVNPFRIVMFFLIHHYMILKKEKEMNMIISYYSYSMYYSSFNSYFRYGVQRPAAMKYAIDNMSNKFHIKKYGSVDKVLFSTFDTAVNTYETFIKRGTDAAVFATISQFITRVKGIFNKIHKEYKNAYDNGNLAYDSETLTDEEGNIVERDSSSMVVDRLANDYTSTFFSSPINEKIISLVGKSFSVSNNELTIAIENIRNERRFEELLSFYKALFATVEKSIPNLSNSDLKGKTFIAIANGVYTKGNTKDPNILFIKDMAHEWLNRSSKTYKASNNIGTLNNFRKAIYFYFVFSVTNVSS